MRDEKLTAEASRLRAAWMRHDAEMLDRYLVSDVEDPRINAQSILSRAFLIDALWPDAFTALIREELRFSICLNWILNVLKTRRPQLSRQRILDALTDGAETCGGLAIPAYLSDAFALMSRETHGLPDYLTAALTAPVSDDNAWLPDCALSTFEQIWRHTLCHREAEAISVLEPACGSANDYRYLHAFGLSRFLDYTGLDICDKNIANAQRRFRAVPFETGDLLDLRIETKSVDYLFVHDLFEHLSPTALQRALAEVGRVTRKQACLSFFNMAEIPDHLVRPQGLYHWNRLSAARIQESLMASAHAVDAVHVATFLQDNYNCPDHHNSAAYTLIVSFE